MSFKRKWDQYLPWTCFYFDGDYRDQGLDFRPETVILMLICRQLSRIIESNYTKPSNKFT